jgi:hypothetical protein
LEDIPVQVYILKVKEEAGGKKLRVYWLRSPLLAVFSALAMCDK